VVVSLLLATGTVAVGAMATVDRAVEQLIGRDTPALVANAALLQALTDAESGERGFLVTGDDRFLDPYERGRQAVGDLLAELRRLAAGDDDVLTAIDHEDRLARGWLEHFAEPVIALRRADPAAAADRAATGEGRIRFDRYRQANAAGAALLGERRDAGRAELERLAERTTLGVALLVLAGGLLGAVVAARTTTAVTRPLRLLQGTLTELADGCLSLRASVDGPEEVRAVARSVNRLAAANEVLMAQRLDFESAQDAALRREREVVEHLRALDRTRQDLVAAVSHELRTPLTSITGYLELLGDEEAGPMNDEQQRLVAIVERNATRLLDLIEEILTLSSIESGSFRLDLAPTDLADVLASVREAMLPAAVGRGVRFIAEVDGDLPLVNVDTGQVERVLLNLVSNAVKFTPAGGRVTLGARRRGASVELVVDDTGMGIPAGEQERLFSPFFRASTARAQQVQGTGLGLAIVHTIVERHGGSVALSSTEGAGTTVRVLLPALEDLDVGALLQGAGHRDHRRAPQVGAPA
jgi:signal transduction histidine kinase